MKKKSTTIFMLVAVMLLMACGRQTADYFDLISNAPEADNALSADIFDLFKSVLHNEKPFSFASGFGTFFLNEYQEMPQVYEMAVFDLFGNGNPSVILNSGPYTLKLVLFYSDGEILAHEFGIRSMNTISQHGTFGWSGGGGSSGTSRVELVENEINYIIIFGRDWLWQGERVEGHIYFMYDRLISYEEYSVLLERELGSESINWYPFTDESINNLAMLETPRIERDGSVLEM